MVDVGDTVVVVVVAAALVVVVVTAVIVVVAATDVVACAMVPEQVASAGQVLCRYSIQRTTAMMHVTHLQTLSYSYSQ